MKPEAQIKALAELDGWELEPRGKSMVKEFPDRIREAGLGSPMLNYYLTSYDAILPLVQKQKRVTQGILSDWLFYDGPRLYNIFDATPAQLCEALLRATGKWKD